MTKVNFASLHDQILIDHSQDEQARVIGTCVAHGFSLVAEWVSFKLSNTNF